MLNDSQIHAIANFDATAVDEVRTAHGAAVDGTSTALVPSPGVEITLPFLLPDAATATYSYTVPEKCEIIDVVCIKDAAGAGNSVQLKNGSGTAISDAIATTTDKAVTRAGTLDKATRVLAAGATLQITNTRAAGSAACAVFVKYIRRA